jgi:hypothetical protein
MQPCYNGCMDAQAITVRLPRDLYEWLRQAAFEQRRSQASIIADALETYRAASA